MAKLALTIAGGVIGSFFGSPELGFLVGGLVGSLVVRPPGIHNEGPRLRDRQVMTATDGAFMPWGYGTTQVGGQVIWAKKGSDGYVVQEKKTTTSQSAKGGPSVTNTTYTYSATFAISFGEGVGDVLRIWADSKIVFNRTKVNNRGTWVTGTHYNVDDEVKGSDGNYYICVTDTALESDYSGITANSVDPLDSIYGPLFWSAVSTVPNSGGTINKYGTPTFYRGDNTQLPDPTIQADKGVNFTPGYRGQIYIVWENVPLADFGNRIPNLRAEIAYASTSNAPTNQIVFPFWKVAPSPTQAQPPNTFAIDPARGLVYTMSANAGLAQRFNTGNGNVEFTVTTDQDDIFQTGAFEPLVGPGGGLGNAAVDKYGFVWAAAVVNVSPNGSSFYSALVCYDPKSFKIVKTILLGSTLNVGLANPTITLFNDAKGNDHIAAVVNNLTALDGSTSPYGPTGWQSAVVVRLTDGTVMGACTLVSPDNPAHSIFNQATVNLGVFDAHGNLWYTAGTSTTGGTWWLWRVNCANDPLVPGAIGAGAVVTGQYTVDTFSFPGDVYSAGAAHPSISQGLLYDPVDDSLIVLMSSQNTGGGGGFHKVDVQTQVILTSAGSGDNQLYLSGGGTLTWTYGAMCCHGPNGWLLDGVIRVVEQTTGVGSHFVVRQYNAASLTLIGDIDPVAATGIVQAVPPFFVVDLNTQSIVFTGGAATAYQPGGGTTPYIYFQYFYNRLNRAGTTPDIIVSDLCQRAGMDAGDIDVTSLATILPVIGYGVTTMTSGQQLVQNLATARFFDGYESDFKLKFRPRGSSSALTLPESDLGLKDDGYEITETMMQDQDLPRTVIVTYSNANANYQAGKQQQQINKRIKKSKNQLAIELPIVLTSADAVQIAEKWLLIKHQERTQYAFNLWNAARLVLDPTDVISFVYENLTFAMRINDVKIGQNFAMQVQGVSEDLNNYLSQSAGATSNGFSDTNINPVCDTILFLLDIPLLIDTDNPPTGSTGYYFGMGPTAETGTWPAGVLYKSTDNADFSSEGFSNTEMPRAFLIQALGAPQFSPYSWDMVNTLVVNITDPNFTPSSTSQLNVLNGANACLVQTKTGWEVVQYQNAVHNSDGTWTLSALLRGRRGTEVFIGGSTSSSLVLFIPQGLSRNNIPTSLIGVQRFYKPVTVGENIANVQSQTATVQGNDLKPYAPAYIKGNLNTGTGDWTIGWLRRTRVGGEWKDGTGDVTMAETGQAYALQFTDSAGNVKRTVILGTNQYTYTAADQSADFGSNQSSLYVNIYEYSAVVGRGFLAQKHITLSETLPPVDATAAMNPLPQELDAINVNGGGDTFVVE